MMKSSIFEYFDRIACVFEEYIPKLAKWMNQNESNNRGNSHAGIAQRKEKISGRAC